MTSVPETLRFRTATPADAARLAEVQWEGFEAYRAFAPPGYRPPARDDIAAILAPRLGRPHVWCMLAEGDGVVAGHVAFLPARDSRVPADDPGLAHFWMLFVREPWWGTGLATRLHAAACDAAREHGYTALRLFTPAGQARARRFYEREGWEHVDGPYTDQELGFPIVEYRRGL